jgi:predicted negative regulator of RcsB-dependent stress response
MRKLLGTLVVLAAVVIGIGFYRGWFTFSTSHDSGTDQRSIHMNIDENKVKSDAEKAKEKASEAAGKIREHGPEDK